MLERAEAAMNDNPSEAIAVLDSIGNDGISHSQRMRRQLTADQYKHISLFNVSA